MGQFDRADFSEHVFVIPSKPLLRSEGSGRADSCRCTKGAHPNFKPTHLPEAKR